MLWTNVRFNQCHTACYLTAAVLKFFDMHVVCCTAALRISQCLQEEKENAPSPIIGSDSGRGGERGREREGAPLDAFLAISVACER